MMRIGVVILPAARWSEAGPLWRRAEELGVDHAWTYDHLTWRSFRDEAWFGAIPTLTAAALTTERLRIGPLVASPNFRHPVPFAKELITLDDISGGRLTLGIGSGGTGWDATTLGREPWTARERTERFAEFVELTDRLLRDPVTSFEGRYYAAEGTRTHPGCVQQPRLPFAVAAAGPRGMGVAAEHGQAWVTTGPRSGAEMLGPPEGSAAVARQIERLAEVCAEVGRDPRSLDRIVVTGLELDAGLSSVAQFTETVGRYAAVGVTDLVVHWPRHEPPFQADPAMFEEIMAR